MIRSHITGFSRHTIHTLSILAGVITTKPDASTIIEHFVSKIQHNNIIVMVCLRKVVINLIWNTTNYNSRFRIFNIRFPKMLSTTLRIWLLHEKTVHRSFCIGRLGPHFLREWLLISTLSVRSFNSFIKQSILSIITCED